MYFNNNAKRKFKQLLYNSFSTREMKHIGGWLDKAFDLYREADFPKGVEIPRSTAAEITVDYFDEHTELDELVAYILSLESYKGREVKLVHLKPFLKSLNESGLKYNAELQRIEKYDRAERGWGILVPDREYYLSCVSIDIVGSSKLLVSFNRDQVESTLRNFRDFVFRRVQRDDGRVWEWLGDGGLVVFLDREHVSDAVLCSIDILSNLILFNNMKNQISKDIEIRIGIHSGFITYKDRYEDITGEAKDEAEMIQKGNTLSNEITITELVMNDLEPVLKKHFYYSAQSKVGKLFQFNYTIGKLDRDII